MTHPIQPLPERPSGDGRRTPRDRMTELWDAIALPAFRSVCGCGLARVPYRIGRTDGLICPTCDRVTS